VAKEVAGTKAKKAYDKIVSGYYGKPLDAIQDYIERSFRSSEANEIVELMEEVKQLKETVAEWKVTLERGKE
jgi:RNA binding exosome subunit